MFKPKTVTLTKIKNGGNMLAFADIFFESDTFGEMTVKGFVLIKTKNDTLFVGSPSKKAGSDGGWTRIVELDETAHKKFLKPIKGKYEKGDFAGGEVDFKRSKSSGSSGGGDDFDEEEEETTGGGDFGDDPDDDDIPF